MYKTIELIKEIFPHQPQISLHEPCFIGNEKAYLNECIDSTFVSSVGKFVDTFEQEFAKKVGSKFAVALVNGTAALHIALRLLNVGKNDEVITQPLSFIATSNAISYTSAKPVFIDVDLDTMGLSPEALERFLEQNCKLENGICKNQKTQKTIKACVPMHTFGHPCKIDQIAQICQKWHIELVEDSAESLGSYYKGKHSGTFGKMGIFSFNGNKIITSGGGGAIVSDDEELAKRAKHLSTTAKMPHPYLYMHDEIAYNYRMPNLNAALLLAQLENLDTFLKNKRELAKIYKNFFKNYEQIKFFDEPKDANSNFWLNSVLLENTHKRNEFLELLNKNKIYARAIWQLTSDLKMYKNCQKDELRNAKLLESQVVNLPSSVRA